MKQHLHRITGRHEPDQSSLRTNTMLPNCQPALPSYGRGGALAGLG
jgi:hypothetical protein